jgi:hypothetical protein
MLSKAEIRKSSLKLREKLRNKKCVVCGFPMLEYTSIWYNLTEDYFSIECCECFSSYDEDFEIRMPGIIFNCGEA